MFFAIASTAINPDTQQVEMMPFMHNLTAAAYNEAVTTIAPRLKAQGIVLHKFNHFFHHDADVMPENCTGCNAALTEQLAIFEERRQADERSKTPTHLAPPATNP
jgi:hypothetical protein